MGLRHLLHARALRPVPPALDLATRFEQSLDPGERHALGAHFTREPDILKIIGPTIERPWRSRIDAAHTPAELTTLHGELLKFHVLDPACGCGNFLLVAYQALLRLESQILARLREFTSTADQATRPRVADLRTDATPRSNALDPTSAPATSISLAQLHGIDINPDAARLAKKLLHLARPTDTRDTRDPDIIVADALFSAWPEVSAIVGNPPFLDARKLSRERPDLDLRALRRTFPAVPGRADLCAYFFRKTHDHLREGQRAGLVGTNTIRQNYSREGSLDHILAAGGTITDAVATQVWPSDAVVHVSIVNWIKGPHTGPCELTTQLGDASTSPWRTQTVRRISSALTATTDVAAARQLASSRRPFCFEGIQPGHRGFRLTAAEYRLLRARDPRIDAVVAPYMNGDDLLSNNFSSAPEHLIDLTDRTLEEVTELHPLLRAHLERTVLSDWRRNAEDERRNTGKPTGEHQNRLARWWQLKRPRPALQKTLRGLPRYIACSRVTKRPIFAFIDSTIKPDSSLTVFAAADDYSFGVLQSSVHWAWFQARCSTLKGDARYTSNTVFDTFPWPQSPTPGHLQAVAHAALELRQTRADLQQHHGWSLRGLYRALETAGAEPLREAQEALDVAVRTAYGMPVDDPLEFLLALNHELADREAAHPISGPGLPYVSAAPFITADRVTIRRDALP